MRVLLVFLICFTLNVAQAKEWNKEWGKSGVHVGVPDSMEVSANGSIYVVGCLNSVAKVTAFDANGNQSWRVYLDDFCDYIYLNSNFGPSLYVTSDENIIVLMKNQFVIISREGQILKSANDFVETMVPITRSYHDRERRQFIVSYDRKLLKYDEQGSVLLEKSVDIVSAKKSYRKGVRQRQLQVDNEGSIFYTTSAHRLQKLSSDGELLWSIDEVNGVEVDGVDVGFYSSFFLDKEGSSYIVMRHFDSRHAVKIDSSGAVVWARPIAGSSGGLLIDRDQAKQGWYITPGKGLVHLDLEDGKSRQVHDKDIYGNYGKFDLYPFQDGLVFGLLHLRSMTGRTVNLTSMSLNDGSSVIKKIPNGETPAHSCINSPYTLIGVSDEDSVVVLDATPDFYDRSILAKYSLR